MPTSDMISASLASRHVRPHHLEERTRRDRAPMVPIWQAMQRAFGPSMSRHSAQNDSRTARRARGGTPGWFRHSPSRAMGVCSAPAGTKRSVRPLSAPRWSRHPTTGAASTTRRPPDRRVSAARAAHARSPALQKLTVMGCRHCSQTKPSDTPPLGTAHGPVVLFSRGHERRGHTVAALSPRSHSSDVGMAGPRPKRSYAGLSRRSSVRGRFLTPPRVPPTIGNHPR
jgi:hypothetical protein